MKRAADTFDPDADITTLQLPATIVAELFEQGLSTVGLLQEALLDGAFLMRARGEPEVGSVDVLAVSGDVDLGARRRHPLDAAQDAHRAFIRESSGSKAEPTPTTVQG